MQGKAYKAIKRSKSRSFIGLAVATLLALPASGAEDLLLETPPQPFTLDLLQQNRGDWRFADAFGQTLRLPGKATLYAFPQKSVGAIELGLLCCDPEFPEDRAKAILKTLKPESVKDGASIFGIDESFMKASVSVKAAEGGSLKIEMDKLAMGPALSGDRYLSAVYAIVDGAPSLAWLAPKEKDGETKARLLSASIGTVFVGTEPVKLTFVELPIGATDAVKKLHVSATDLFSGEKSFEGDVSVSSRTAASPKTAAFELPLEKFGVFDVKAANENGEAALRVCRIPKPRDVAPEEATIGVNVFQQQIWWYTHQAPLLAEAGVHIIRPWLKWENSWEFQERRQGERDLRALDAALRRTAALRQDYQYILVWAPDWLTGKTAFGTPTADKIPAWSDYVSEIVAHCKGRVKYWEVWNEPDGMWLAKSSQEERSREYAQMLKASYFAAKKADPDCKVVGFSTAVDPKWMEGVLNEGTEGSFDVASIHNYRNPAAVYQRWNSLLRRNLEGRPLWINEIGASGYDFKSVYAERYPSATERFQAETLTKCFAQSLAYASQVHWFCSLDPRDPASSDVGDSAYGLLYLGLTPKLSYAALAGLTFMIDGRKCVGELEIQPNVRQASFDGLVSVVWSETSFVSNQTKKTATELGCRQDETITTRDLFSNIVAQGRAGEMEIDLSKGPVFIEGSLGLSDRAKLKAALRIVPSSIEASEGQASFSTVIVAEGATPELKRDPSSPVEAVLRPMKTGGNYSLELRAKGKEPFKPAKIVVTAKLDKGRFGLEKETGIEANIAVSCLGRGFSDSFSNLDAWAMERGSVAVFDCVEGHDAPGSLRLDAPFDQRCACWLQDLTFSFKSPLSFSMQVKTKDVDKNAQATMNIAFFSKAKWLKTLCVAKSQGAPKSIEKNWAASKSQGSIPTGTSDWTRIACEIAPSAIPSDTTAVVLFLDVSKGATGQLWIDDVELVQDPSDENASSAKTR